MKLTRGALVGRTVAAAMTVAGLAACSDDDPSELRILGAEVLDNGELQVGVACADDLEATEEDLSARVLTVTVTGRPKDGDCGATVTLAADAADVGAIIDGSTGEPVPMRRG